MLPTEVKLFTVPVTLSQRLLNIISVRGEGSVFLNGMKRLLFKRGVYVVGGWRQQLPEARSE